MDKNAGQVHVHTSLIPLRWGDMDAMGHVNNTVYFRYMEQARIEWLESTGLLASARQEEGPVIVNASCTFHAPLTYPGTVEVRVFTGAAGRSSIPTHYEMRLVGQDKIYADGGAKLIWTSTRTGKSAPLPERLRAVVDTQWERTA